MRDAKTGLLYHGWDESKEQRWADKKTGLSPEFWGRAMGWYMMALVDTLDYYPADDAGRKQLLAILGEEAAALVRVQDAKTGLWYEVLDKGSSERQLPGVVGLEHVCVCAGQGRAPRLSARALSGECGARVQGDSREVH